MIVQPEFLTHWKTRKLVRLLKDPCAPLYVIRIWALCQTSKSAEIPSSAETIAGICEYDEDSTSLRKALVDCGFLEPQKNGKYKVHDWEEMNLSLINSWSNGKKGGRPRLSAVFAKSPHEENSIESVVPEGSPSKNPIESGVKTVSASSKKLKIQHEENQIESSWKNPRDTHGIPTANPTREDQIRPDRLDRKDQNQPEAGGVPRTVGKVIGSILKSPDGSGSGSGHISFQGQGYSRAEMIRHACTGSKHGDIRAKDVFDTIEVLSDFEALKICDEVNAIRMDERKEAGYLVGVFRKKLFIKGES